MAIVLEEIENNDNIQNKGGYYNINNQNYRLLRKTNKSTIKVVKGLLYINITAEIIKMVAGRRLVVTLVSTIGASFFVGSLYFMNKLKPEQMIKLKDNENANEQQEEDNEEDENENEEEEEEEEHVDCSNKTVALNFTPLYKFIPYGIATALIGNGVASLAMGLLYGFEVPLEWNTVFYREIGMYITNTTVQNFAVVVAVDLIYKSKYQIYKKSIKNKNN